MSDEDIKRLTELAEKLLAQPRTKEEAFAMLVAAGIFDANGDYTPPYQEMLQEEE